MKWGLRRLGNPISRMMDRVGHTFRAKAFLSTHRLADHSIRGHSSQQVLCDFMISLKRVRSYNIGWFLTQLSKVEKDIVTEIAPNDILARE